MSIRCLGLPVWHLKINHCPFLHHNPVSGDWLYCVQVMGPTFGSVTLLDFRTKGRGLRLGKGSPMREGATGEWIPAAAGWEGPRWPAPEKKGAPKRPPLQSRQMVGKAPREQAAYSGSLEQFSILHKGKGGKRL